MEVSGVLFDVCFERYEVFVDEGGGFVVAVRFGFQPNTSASGGSGAEIDQHRSFTGLCFRERRVGICHPVNFHVFSPRLILTSMIKRAGPEEPTRYVSRVTAKRISDDARCLLPGLLVLTICRALERRSPCASTGECSTGTYAIRPGVLRFLPSVLLQFRRRE